jgi:predicted O-methyltransferase YrrM
MRPSIRRSGEGRSGSRREVPAVGRCNIEYHPGQVFLDARRIKKDRRVLEVGTFAGHATLEIAAPLPDGGTIATIDSLADANAREIALSAFMSSRHRDKIRLMETDALSALDRVGKSCDLIFIDADKPNCKAYYEKIIRTAS